MNIQESISRGFNLLAISIVALAGFAFMAEIVIETEWSFKIDDAVLLLLGIFAIVWYRYNTNRFKLSIVPVVLVALALVTKFAAIFVEISQADDVGDDFGGLTLFVFATALVLYQYYKTKKLLAESRG